MVDVPGRQPVVRPRAPVPGGRRLPDAEGAVRRPRGPSARLRGRRQQRGRVARFAAALSGVELTVASPPGYELDDVTVERARNLGGRSSVTDPYEAVRGADAVYTDVWTSMGQEDEAAVRRAAFEGYTVDAS